MSDKLAEIQLGSILLPQTLADVVQYPLVNLWTKDDDRSLVDGEFASSDS